MPNALDKRVSDLVCIVLDRPRHEHIIKELRAANCGVRLIPDGDVAAAIAPCLPNSGVDIYIGIGGSTEAVLAASGIKCLGGELLCRMFPRDEEERKSLVSEHKCTPADFEKVWCVDEMAKGDNIIFVATGITDSAMLRGIRYENHLCVTESMLIRARYRTLRRVIGPPRHRSQENSAGDRQRDFSVINLRTTAKRSSNERPTMWNMVVQFERDVRRAAVRWYEDDGPLMSAATAYYVGLSFFPLLFVLIAGVEWFLRNTHLGQDAQQKVLAAIAQNMSPELADYVRQSLGMVRR